MSDLAAWLLLACALVLVWIIAEATTSGQCRSSISGKIASSSYARFHPNTTRCAEI